MKFKSVSMMLPILIIIAAGTARAEGPGRDVSLFAEGCPESGRSRAGLITDPRVGMQGPDALGGAGDYLLINDRAAFIVEGLDRINTYYYYGGIVIDAVALAGCAQANPETYEELGLFVGRVDHDKILATGVRSFRGERIEVINDGSDGGDAVVRVHGTDDVFWIVELELIRMVYQMVNIPKPPTRPLGVDLFVDYILPPDSAALRIEFNIVNQDRERKKIFTAAGGFFGDANTNYYYSDGTRSLAGFDISTGLPFLVSASGKGAWAFGWKDADLGTTNLSGFDAILDVNQMRHRLTLEPAGQSGDALQVTHYLAVGDSDPNSALSALNEINPGPLPGWDMKLTPFGGVVRDRATGAPLPGAKIELAIKNRKGQWSFLDGFESDEQGEFGGLVPDLGRECRLTAVLEGRPDPVPVYFKVSETSRVDLDIEPGGTLAYEVRDGEGRGLPAKIGLYQGPKLVQTIYCQNGFGEARVVPGRYEVSVTRGYEYIPYEGTVEIAPAGTSRVEAVLVRAVDTRGYLSADMHLHAGPSGDNKITIPERIVTAAAEGLEVAVSTDHEAIIPWRLGIEETGLGDWVATVLGEEVTATVPEHMNMFPAEARFDIDARGGAVRWYGLDIGEAYQAIRERGGEVVQLNHARNNCSYMCLIDYDRATGEANLEHPEYLGLEPGDSLWSWNFDSIEYQNGNDRVFMDPLHPKSSGTFEDWMSFINLGHRITAVANTDTHDWGTPGSPRTYFPSPTDLPAEFQAGYLVSAIKEGRALASTGAFARVMVNDAAGMGDTAVVAGETVDLWVHIESIPQIDVSSFKVFVNCDQKLEVKLPASLEVVKYDGHVAVPVRGDSQIVVMGFGRERLPRGFKQFDPRGVPRFTSNPIYIDQGGDGYVPPGWDGCRYTRP